jgi:hypothetical protein
MGNAATESQGYRVVRVWSAKGSAMMAALSGISLFVIPTCLILLTLVVVGAGAQVWDVLTGTRELAPLLTLRELGGALLIVLSGTVVLGGCVWVRGRHRVLRAAAAAAAGPDAAFALACLAEPELFKEPSTERAHTWFTEFRCHSRDALIMNASAAEAIGSLATSSGMTTVTLRGTPRRVAIAAVLVTGLILAVLIWLLSDGLVDFVVGLSLDLVAGAGAMSYLLFRERRLGGDRTVEAGAFQHGTISWTPAEAVMVARRYRFGPLAWYRIHVIGTPGITSIWILDRPASTATLRDAMVLWMMRG